MGRAPGNGGGGGSPGESVKQTLQASYDGSKDGRIITDTTRGPLKIRWGGAGATGAIEVESTPGVSVFRVDGAGEVSLLGGNLVMPSRQIVFDTDLDTFITSPSDDVMDFHCGAGRRMRLTGAILSMSVQLSPLPGTATSPGMRNNSDQNTGTFNPDIGEYSVTCGGVEVTRCDENTTSGETRFMLYDIDTGAVVRVSVGSSNSGGAGFKVLRVPN